MYPSFKEALTAFYEGQRQFIAVSGRILVAGIGSDLKF
jgi:hypothetical protein